MFSKKYTISNKSDIPRGQGIYAFYIDLFSPPKLGLLGRGPFSEEQLVRAKVNLLKRISQVINLTKNRMLKGALIEENKKWHLAERYILYGHEDPPIKLLNYLNKLPADHVNQYLKLASSTTFFCQPVYVGITIKQTLKDRYKQHYDDFNSESESSSSFGKRLKQAGIDWDDVVFVCSELEVVDDNNIILDLLEKYIHTMSRPVFSIR